MKFYLTKRKEIFTINTVKTVLKKEEVLMLAWTFQTCSASLVRVGSKLDQRKVNL